MKNNLKIRSLPGSAVVGCIFLLLVFLACAVISILVFISNPTVTSLFYMTVAVLFEMACIWFANKYVLAALYKYVIVSDEGILFVCRNAKVKIPWANVKKVAMQGFLPNDYRGGFAVLSMDFDRSTVNLDQIAIPYFLFKKETDLNGFLGPDKLDISISLKFAKESEDKLFNDIFQRNGFTLTKMKPLIETESQAKYDEIFEANFDAKSFS